MDDPNHRGKKLKTYECVLDLAGGDKRFSVGEEITTWLRDPDTFESVHARVVIRPSFAECPDSDALYYVSATAGRDCEAVPVLVLENVLMEQGNDEIVALRRQIRELKLAERALRHSRYKYRSLADSLPETIYEISKKCKIEFLNKMGFDTFGYRKNDLANGLNVLHLFVQSEHERVRRNIGLILSGNILGPNSYIGRRKDGTKFPVIVSSNPVVRGREVVGLRGIIVDVTERIEAEERVRTSEAALRASEEDVRMLAGKLLTAQEEERSRLARELHDDFSQRLAALAIEAGKLELQMEGGDGQRVKKLGEMRERRL